MKKILLILSIVSFGCAFPLQISIGEPTPTPQATLTPTQTPLSTAEPGTESNPLILALAPSPRPTDSVIAAGEVIAAFIQSRTGYRIVTVIPASETVLLDSISKGNAHIMSLSPYGYAIAFQRNDVTALLARVREGEIFYGAQIIANREKDFTAYFDEVKNENTTDVISALKQFQEKKPCWSDEVSPSGYVIPLGLLNQAGVQTRSGAFLANQPSVVRAVYADDICDFGATFIDARTSPTLEADYPDVIDKVKVIWRIPAIIPYENISMSSDLPFEMRRVIQRALIDLMLTPDGKSAIQTVYGFDEVQVVEDSAYTEFIALVNASGLDLLSLIE
ncbi:MAG: phosphate/phosphite/phosphonate ABC transporter substrate-binding protein [Anaerolineales bacterium]|nr:phosphate/phosphite/phosphonate ABC transporter substrate-binding protein [Anaerolineales bacterium]